MTTRTTLSSLLSAALALNTVMSVGLGMDMGGGEKTVDAHACCPVSQSPAPENNQQGGPSCCSFSPALLPCVCAAKALKFVRIVSLEAPRLHAPTIAGTPLSALPPPGYTAAARSVSSSRAPPRA